MLGDIEVAEHFYVTPDGGPRRYQGSTIKGHRFQEAIDLAEPGDRITVVPGVYDEPVTIEGKRGGPNNKLRIVGDAGATLDGRRMPVRPPGLAQKDHYAFIKVLNSSGVTVENMTIQRVWPTAIYIEDSQHIDVLKMNLNGATYGVFARGADTEHLLLEHCSWIQDDRIWDQVFWKDIHDSPLPRRELDGDFFRSKDIRGGVVIRQNFIAQAFNGVHFFAEERVKPGTFNVNVWIYRNTFAFIRDNAIEAENTATNWWVFENKIYNCHIWFAFEQCNGGYIYLFSNRGWFDRRPGPPGDCHAGGAVIKSSKVKDTDHEAFLPQHPVYVFNNSWYLRSTYLKKGKLRHFRHFNNAIAYARPEHHPSGLVDLDRRMIGVGDVRDLRCEGPGEPDKPFTKDWAGLDIAFQRDVCDHPHYPGRLNAEGYPVRGVPAHPGFRSAREGDFALIEGSPCVDIGSTPVLELPGGRSWPLRGPLNIGAMQNAEEPKPYGPLVLGAPREALPSDYVENSEA